MNERDIFDRRTIFKTRNMLCRIAVRADHEKCEQITKTRRRNCGVCTSFGDQQKRVRPINPASVRFTENRTLKTADSQRHRGLRFPNGTCRRKTTGLLEQMPWASARMVLIATSPLRSTSIVIPRRSSALAKSKPYKLCIPNARRPGGRIICCVSCSSTQPFPCRLRDFPRRRSLTNGTRSGPGRRSDRRRHPGRYDHDFAGLGIQSNGFDGC